jgi:hypothetical protein
MYHRFIKYWVYLFVLFVLCGCDQIIDVPLEEAAEVVIVDAWINDKYEPQVIKIKLSLPYFEDNALPGVKGAKVRVIKENGDQFDFIESEIKDGEYIWMPSGDSINIGQVGDRFVLDVEINGFRIGSFSEMRRVPDIDSIDFRLASDNPILKGSYLAQFYASDFIGTGDTYWIKAYKNGEFLSKPSEINIAFDAGFSRGDNVDGVSFNKFIRSGVNPYDQDDNGDIISPYMPGDSLYVEIHSLTNLAYSYLFEVSVQTNRPGGITELLAVPLANVPTNIVNVTNGEPVTGFFSVSAVKSLGKKFLDEED